MIYHFMAGLANLGTTDIWGGIMPWGVELWCLAVSLTFANRHFCQETPPVVTIKNLDIVFRPSGGEPVVYGLQMVFINIS